MIARGTVPFVATAIRFPPPATALLHPNPLATRITPSSAADRSRGEHEGVLLAVQRDSVTDNDAAVINGFGEHQDLEIARGQVAERVQIEHLPLGEKKSVLGVFLGGGRADNHARGVEVLLPGYACGAGRSAERSQIGQGVGEFCRRLPVGADECGGHKKNRKQNPFCPIRHFPVNEAI